MVPAWIANTGEEETHRPPGVTESKFTVIGEPQTRAQYLWPPYTFTGRVCMRVHVHVFFYYMSPHLILLVLLEIKFLSEVILFSVSLSVALLILLPCFLCNFTSAWFLVP